MLIFVLADGYCGWLTRYALLVVAFLHSLELSSVFVVRGLFSLDGDVPCHKSSSDMGVVR